MEEMTALLVAKIILWSVCSVLINICEGAYASINTALVHLKSSFLSSLENTIDCVRWKEFVQKWRVTIFSENQRPRTQEMVYLKTLRSFSGACIHLWCIPYSTTICIRLSKLHCILICYSFDEFSTAVVCVLCVRDMTAASRLHTE